MSPIERTSLDFSQPVALGAGNWDLDVDVYLSATDASPTDTVNIPGIVISGGTTVTRNVVFNIHPSISGSGEGTFSWDIDFSRSAESPVAGIEMNITELDGTPVWSSKCVESPWVDSFDDLEAGYYWVNLILINSSGLVVIERKEILHVYEGMESHFKENFSNIVANVIVRINSNADNGSGSLRAALGSSSIAPAGSIIIIEKSVGTIELSSQLAISRKLTIQGNGVIITPSNTWIAYNSSQLLFIGSDVEVNISRVHFKNGRALDYAGAINNWGILTLESCIFSGNQGSGTYVSGGAIVNNKDINIMGCTFFDNHADGASTGSYGGVIYNGGGTLKFAGNLFYGNTGHSFPVVYPGGSVISLGYNVVDVPIGKELYSSGWVAADGDKTISDIPVSPVTYKLLQGNEAEAVINTIPEGYPVADFYANAVLPGAAAGSVQSCVSGSGYTIYLRFNNLIGNVTISETPDEDGLYTADSVVRLTAVAETGGFFKNWLVNGVEETGATLDLTMDSHHVVRALFREEFLVNDPADTDTQGTLRYALNNAQDEDIISIDRSTVDTIVLRRELLVAKSVTIQGNGVTIMPGSPWDLTSYSQLLIVNNANATVSISRVHFKDGRAISRGAAIECLGNLNLESCIFSGNRSSGFSAYGGAVYCNGILNVMGCSFFDNHAEGGMYGRGGAIYFTGTAFNLAGNIFYGNTAYSGKGIYRDSGTVTSLGYNVIDAPFGEGDDDSGWTQAGTDKTISDVPMTPVSFRLLSGSDAGGVITSLPSGYPGEDFYGDPITVNAAAGAVQSYASGSGYLLYLSINDESKGSVDVSPASNPEGINSSGTVTLTAMAKTGGIFKYWLVNRAEVTGATLILTMDSHYIVTAFFGREILVDNPTDTSTQGTLRYALKNAQDEDVISIDSAVGTIELASRLEVSSNITIKGNGVTIKPGSSWISGSGTQMLYVDYGAVINISRVHFKNGRTIYNGAAIMNNGYMTLESCIFSGNEVYNPTSGPNGGAIFNDRNLTVLGCTFYNNHSISGSIAYGGVIYTRGEVILAGNLFYGNTAYNGPVVCTDGFTGTVTSLGHNVADVVIGSNTWLGESGWDAEPGDTTFTALSISGSPFNNAGSDDFAPVDGMLGHIETPSSEFIAVFPTTDFFGNTRNTDVAGAVR